MVKKRIAVSQKRQITLPIDFFNEIGVGDEVECYVHNNSIIIRPVHDVSGEFDEEILADLIKEGLSGNELFTKFKEIRHKIRPAVESMLEEAALVAEGKAPAYTYEEVFGAEEDS